MAFTLGKRGVFQVGLQMPLAVAFFSLLSQVLLSPVLAERCPAAQTAASGMIVVRYLYDSTLHRSWAVERDCAHRETPAWLMPTDSIPDEANLQAKTLRASSPAADAKAGLWVRAGSRVRVWRVGEVRIELSGIALESAPVGSELAVRIGMQGAVVHGIVRGPDSIELVPASPQWGQP